MGFHFMVFGPPRSQQSKIPGRTRNHVSKIQVYPRAIFATYHGPGVCVYPAGPPASQRLPASVSLTHVVGLWLDCGWTVVGLWLDSGTNGHPHRQTGRHKNSALVFCCVVFLCCVSMFHCLRCPMCSVHHVRPCRPCCTVSLSFGLSFAASAMECFLRLC